MKILVLNMARSIDRLAAIEKAFCGESLTVIDAVDGHEFAGGDVNEFGKPLFDASAFKALQDKGIVSKKHIYGLSPFDVGCALSHMKAWRTIIDAELPGAVIIEDDVKPGIGYLRSFKDSIDVSGKDVLFLYAEKLKKHDDNSVRFMSSTMGYYISNEAARSAIDSMTPIYMPVDMQWFSMAFQGYSFHANIQDIAVKKHLAYIKEPFVIEAAKCAAVSTMSQSGRKPWRE